MMRAATNADKDGGAPTPATTHAIDQPVKAPRTPPALTLEIEDGKLRGVSVSGDFDRIWDAVGADNKGVAHGLVGQIAMLGASGKGLDGDASNFVLGFVDSMEPKDATEALLLTQMGAIHQATMAMARRLVHTDTIPQQDSAERALNKLARTYAAQVEALKRYRSKGQQVVRVERVTVESGGQAVVGDVHHGGRGRS